MPSIFMETTKIAPDRTASEIQAVLAKYGATCIQFGYRNGVMEDIAFKIIHEGKELPFILPARWEQIKTLLMQNGKRAGYNDTIEDWARRVAWRQVLRWVQAQFAMVETGMVKTWEVFLPYMQQSDGRTIAQVIEQNHFAYIGYEEK